MPRELIEYIAKSLVDNPGDVRVSEAGDGQAVVIGVQVAKEDLGKIIGRQGRTAKAMRTLLGAVAARAGRRLTLEILE